MVPTNTPPPKQLLRSLERHAPQHCPCSPAQAPPPPPALDLWTSLYCTLSPKIAHIKDFGELAWANMGKKWLKMA